MPGSNDDAAGEHGGVAQGALRTHRQNAARGGDADNLDLVADSEIGDAAVPAQIAHPVAPRNPGDLLPGFGTVARLKPGTHRQARYAELGADQDLRRTQHLHAGEGVPRSLISGRIAIKQQDVANALALQRQADDQPSLPGTDNDNVVNLSPHRIGDRPDPGRTRMRERIEIAPCLFSEPG